MQASFMWLVAQREYLENIRTKAFWLGALLMPVIFLVMLIVPTLLARDSDAVYAVVDESGWVHDAVRKTIVERDVDAFLGVVGDLTSRAYDKITDSELRNELRLALEDQANRERFRSQLISLIYYLTIENGQIRDPSNPAERIANWWVSNLETVAEFAPDTSFSSYEEIRSQAASVGELTELLHNDEILGFFVIPDDPVAGGTDAQYVTKNLTNRDLQNWFERLVSEVVQTQRIREENIDEETALYIQERIKFTTQQLDESGEKADADMSDTLRQWAPVAFVYLLFMSIMVTSQMLLTSTIEEKTNKLVEVLLSSISAIDLMAGKIVGIALTGGTLVLLWLLAFLVFLIGMPILLDLNNVIDLTILIRDPTYIFHFIVYYVLGYFLYASSICGIGALCSNLKEAQNIAMPVQMLTFVPLLVMLPITKDPNGTLSQVLSFVPPFTPFVMLNRSAFPPSWIVYVTTTLLLLVTIWWVLRVSAKLFETGILMTGKPPKLAQLTAILRGNKG